jgi:hypothetical protein
LDPVAETPHHGVSRTPCDHKIDPLRAQGLERESIPGIERPGGIEHSHGRSTLARRSGQCGEPAAVTIHAYSNAFERVTQAACSMWPGQERGPSSVHFPAPLPPGCPCNHHDEDEEQQDGDA